jgi:hypothetical protein
MGKYNKFLRSGICYLIGHSGCLVLANKSINFFILLEFHDLVVTLPTKLIPV